MDTAISRSFSEGPDYLPWWRYVVFSSHINAVARSDDHDQALTELVAKEKDKLIRHLLCWHSGEPGPLAPSIAYALKCHRSRDSSAMAATIAAMVIAGQTTREIATQLQIPRVHVLVFVKLFFDIRCCRYNLFFLCELCYSAAVTEWLGKTGRRRLITALERGWAGLYGAFANGESERKPTGQAAWDHLVLGLLGRLADGVRASDMRGSEPSKEEAAVLALFLERPLPPEILQLTYPEPRTAAEIQSSAEAKRIVSALPAASRRKLAELLSRVRHALEMPPKAAAAKPAE